MVIGPAVIMLTGFLSSSVVTVVIGPAVVMFSLAKGGWSDSVFELLSLVTVV